MILINQSRLIKYYRINTITRLFSDFRFPDNAPRTADNQSWLEHLENQDKLSENISNAEDYSINAENEDIIDKSLNSRFSYKVISRPPESRYIEIKSPLQNFTSLKYLKSLENDINKNKNRQTGFIDTRIIKCRSGNGGHGAVSFFRDAGRSIGPPDGGDGGDGGSVYIQAVEGIDSLAKLKTTYIAQDGKAGTADQLDGAKGKDMLITVPIGTTVRWCMDPVEVKKFIKEKNLADNKQSIREFTQSHDISLQCVGKLELNNDPFQIQMFRESYKPGKGWIFKGKDEEYHLQQPWFKTLNKRVTTFDVQLRITETNEDRFPLYGIDLSKATTTPICLLKGGNGGLGNMHFLTQMIRNPRFAKEGRNGLEQHFLLELKTIADIGLVGFPNAGKSTILNKISNAKPRIGHWKFTTLVPTIGTVSKGVEETPFTVADIPGIIEGASLNKGMGLDFIKHIQRSKSWVFVLSLESPDPIEDMKTLVYELGGMDKVTTKNILVVCNKADLLENNETSIEKFSKVNEFCKKNNWDCIPISALKNENIDELIQRMAKSIRMKD
ncbi:hypothetical protein TPHA_0A05310 [Tetrapisispora phaffii CBS 4417]|uniref:OBG-type G domain-containing protein n=1 Tax=Tetrapisispora phaffii (strain ATCC 24235 / CBS 4417 / NBRC 1672 / NRRL Y-8282 / UCD 70-5) TaxID=1071381 RepID=G8BNX7_TETPH|nr:hypothetical protein TPHA_0A05310 [Tetrapisispora phaffii CBS 4417]CCE61605.1 hypothetical protein TPHA_0A05310 [Tetrapisispora phaffii CBS 4417]